MSGGKAKCGDTIRVQLKLSPAVIRVLQTVRQEDFRASKLVEEILWDSARVRDTAGLVGIPCPRRRRRAGRRRTLLGEIQENSVTCPLTGPCAPHY